MESGGVGSGPLLVIRKRDAVISIHLLGMKVESEVSYILDFSYDSRGFARIVYSEDMIYILNKVPTYPTIFMDKILEVSRDHPALMDFILWNLV